MSERQPYLNQYGNKSHYLARLVQPQYAAARFPFNDHTRTELRYAIDELPHAGGIFVVLRLIFSGLSNNKRVRLL